MKPACVRYDQLPGSSRLFLDYQYDFERVARFYARSPHDPKALHEAAAQAEYPDERRAATLQALREQNAESAALATLGRPGAVAVVTGQQVGLFSGPCYTIYKAITAALLARQLTEAGIPAAPVFWLATEDHDFAEVNHCWVFDKEHRPVRLSIDGASPGNRPVGDIPVQNPPVDELRRALRDFPFCEETVALVVEAYRPGSTMGSAFAELLRRALKPLGLLLLDPLQPAVRRLAAPMLREAVLAAPRLAARLRERNIELVEAGYHAQVHVEEETSLVFLLEEGRRIALRRRGGEYTAEGRRYSAEELANQGERLSPNALLRPVVQDFLLPTAVYVGGPAELAYLAQSRVIYDELRRPAPVAISRQSATLLDARSVKLMERYELQAADCFQGEEALRERIAQQLVPAEVTSAMQAAKSQSAQALDGLATALTRFDPTLEASFAKSRRKIAWQLSKIEGKAAREALRRDERAAGAAAHLSGLLYPEKKLQERFYSILPFLARHGLDVAERLMSELTPACTDHRVIAL